MQILFLLVFLALPAWGSSSLQPKVTEISGDCLAHLAYARTNWGRVSGVSIAYDEAGVVFKKNLFKALRIEWDTLLGTVRFLGKDGRVPLDTEALTPVFHGNGADYSHSGSMLNALSILNQRRANHHKRGGKASKGPSVVEEMIHSENYIRLAAESIDFPHHGAGPVDPAFNDLNYTLDWLATELRQLKALAPGLPLVPIARSGSTALLTAVTYRHPGLIDGMILVSPVHPVIALEESRAFEAEEIQKGVYTPNLVGLDWIFKMARDMQNTWGYETNPFKIPTFILTGKDDRDMLWPLRERWAEFAQASRLSGNSLSEYWDVPGRQHDAIATGSSPEISVEVYLRMQKFIRQIADGKR